MPQKNIPQTSTYFGKMIQCIGKQADQFHKLNNNSDPEIPSIGSAHVHKNLLMNVRSNLVQNSQSGNKTNVHQQMKREAKQGRFVQWILFGNKKI